jgi:hypothetical protein
VDERVLRVLLPILEESTDPKIREGNDAKWRKNADQFAREKKMPTLERNVDQIARVMMPNRASRNQFEIQKAHTDKRAICPNDSPGKYNGITVPH